jgi:hypothetical protein
MSRDEIDAKRLKLEVVAVAKRVHELIRKDAMVREASVPGVLAGMALYHVLTARALGMGAKDVHELVDAVDHDFPTLSIKVPPEAQKLVRALEADDPEAVLRAIAEMLGVGAKVDEKAVADADARADELIRKMAETLEKEPKGD